jgi:hypothetical protein
MSSVRNRDQVQDPLSRQLAEHYDLAWMGEEDVTTRLWRGLRLVRNIVPIVYQANVVVEWASPACQYCGLMIQDVPPRILIDPKPVLSCTPRKSAAVLDAIQGVGLHEAGHAAHTPERWGERAGELLTVHARTTRRRLPEGLIMPILNWAEDIYIEDRVAQQFPGFRAYFENACTFFLSMPTCRRRLTRLRTLLAAFRRDPHELADIA